MHSKGHVTLCCRGVVPSCEAVCEAELRGRVCRSSSQHRESKSICLTLIPLSGRTGSTLGEVVVAEFWLVEIFRGGGGVGWDIWGFLIHVVCNHVFSVLLWLVGMTGVAGGWVETGNPPSHKCILHIYMYMLQ